MSERIKTGLQITGMLAVLLLLVSMNWYYAYKMPCDRMQNMTNVPYRCVKELVNERI
jgi:uncharacterized membrane protein